MKHLEDISEFRSSPELVEKLYEHGILKVYKAGDSPLAQVSRFFATYNLVVAPVVDSDGALVGAVTVDDVLDHMLPDDWRGTQMDELVEVSHG